MFSALIQGSSNVSNSISCSSSLVDSFLNYFSSVLSSFSSGLTKFPVYCSLMFVLKIILLLRCFADGISVWLGFLSWRCISIRCVYFEFFWRFGWFSVWCLERGTMIAIVGFAVVFLGLEVHLFCCWCCSLFLSLFWSCTLVAAEIGEIDGGGFLYGETVSGTEIMLGVCCIEEEASLYCVGILSLERIWMLCGLVLLLLNWVFPVLLEFVKLNVDFSILLVSKLNLFLSKFWSWLCFVGVFWIQNIGCCGNGRLLCCWSFQSWSRCISFWC